MKIRIIFVLLLLALTINEALSAPDGAQLYDANCVVCHGDNGQGGIGLPLNTEKFSSFSSHYLQKTIRLGRPGRVMPDFNHLSDSQVDAIIDFLQSNAEVGLNDEIGELLATGNVYRGKSLYENKCVSCHGENGKTKGQGTGVTLSRDRVFKIIPPELNNSGFLQSADDQQLKRMIEWKEHDPYMSAFYFNFSEQNIADLVSYIRTFEQHHQTQQNLSELSPSIIVDSPYDFDTTVENLKQSLNGMNFRYFPDRYLEQGLAKEEQINKKQINIRFCNFNRLYHLLNTDPRLGIFLPCRISVVEQPDGQVQLVVMNMTLMADIFNNRQLSEDANAMFEVILEIMDEATL